MWSSTIFGLRQPFYINPCQTLALDGTGGEAADIDAGRPPPATAIPARSTPGRWSRASGNQGALTTHSMRTVPDSDSPVMSPGTGVWQGRRGPSGLSQDDGRAASEPGPVRGQSRGTTRSQSTSLRTTGGPEGSAELHTPNPVRICSPYKTHERPAYNADAGTGWDGTGPLLWPNTAGLSRSTGRSAAVERGSRATSLGVVASLSCVIR